MKTRILHLSLLVFSLTLCAKAQPKVTLKFATLAPEGSAWMQAFDRAKQEVLEATKGEVALKVFPA